MTKFPLFPLFFFVGTCLSRLHSYLLFHSFVEIFSAVVAFGIFIIAWNTRRRLEDSYFLLLGTGTLFVGIIDLLHALAYKGMGIFPSDANLPTQLWIAGRYLNAFSFLASGILFRRPISSHRLLLFYLVTTGILLFSVFGGVFPDCYIEGVGLTPFKRVSEFLIILLLAGGLLLLHRRPLPVSASTTRLIVLSIVLLIGADAAFTLYQDVYGVVNMTGHLLKLMADYLIYKAVVETALVDPVEVLFRRLKESEESLGARAQELEKANRDLEAFNYTISHDLRSPLTAVSGFAEVLLKVPGLPEQEKRRYLQNIHAQSLRMDEITTTLLNFSRLSRCELSREEVNLSELAAQVVLGLQVREPGRCVFFSIGEEVKGLGDRALLQLTLENLLGNAWKYSRGAPEARIEFGLDPGEKGEEVYFVRDNGIGFPMEQAGEIFQPFRRAHGKSDFEGTGIGLATVSRIVERHGGRIWAESIPGAGATFYFTLT